MTYIKDKNNSACFSRCQYHIAHNASAATITALMILTGFDIQWNPINTLTNRTKEIGCITTVGSNFMT